MKRYVRCVRRGNGSRGFAMMYVLLLVLAAGIAAAVLVPRCASWYHAALVRYEADCLVSDLRLLQQLSRTAAVYHIEVPSEIILGHFAAAALPLSQAFAGHHHLGGSERDCF